MFVFETLLRLVFAGGGAPTGYKMDGVIVGRRSEIRGGPHPFGQKSGTPPTPPTLSKILQLSRKIHQNYHKKEQKSQKSKLKIS
jgi:hypothetical protein